MRRASLTFGTAVFLALAPFAHAELTERGDLFVRFSGGLQPTALPRHSLAPIAISVTGAVKTLSGSRPPALRRIKIELNRGGRIDTAGLPICRRSQIESGSTAQALASCRDALVGSGTYVANTAFPEQSAFPSQGRITAFNAVVAGRRAILAHVYGRSPVSIVRIIVFEIRDGSGAFGTILTGSLPPSINRWGYVEKLSLRLHRRFTYRGRPRSYLSAACPAPAGFPGAVFPFARASMGFADGRTLTSTLTRSCSVLGR